MSVTTAVRGRPKGTGIDDRQQLRSIAHFIKTKPGTKPTTAIRALGVTDPSVIRRLRDKYRDLEAELMADMRDEAPPKLNALKSLPVRAPSRAAGQPASPSSREAAANAAPPIDVRTPANDLKPATVSSTPDPTPQATASVAAKPAGPRPSSFVTSAQVAVAWYSVGLHAIGAAIEIQAEIAARWMTMPAASLMMRQQLLVNEAALAIFKARPTRGMLRL